MKEESVRDLIEASKQSRGPTRVRDILTRPRRDQKDLTVSERDAFNYALRSAINDGTYQAFVDIHMDMTHDMHGTGHGDTGFYRFLPWHRVYLYKMEELLQTYVPYLRIPYWDWEHDRSPYEEPFTWIIQPKGVTRYPLTALDPASPGGQALLKLPNQADVDYIRGQTTYADFATKLEYAHNNVHSWVGGAEGGIRGKEGTMGDVMGSPADPLFWLHHANVDRIWSMWQPLPGKAYSAAYMAQRLPPLSGPKAHMDPWPQYTPADVSNTLDLYYYYTPPKQKNPLLRPPDRQRNPRRHDPRLRRVPINSA
jgi:tyrosinase